MIEIDAVYILAVHPDSGEKERTDNVVLVGQICMHQCDKRD